jgi:hypothetical protein
MDHCVKIRSDPAHKVSTSVRVDEKEHGAELPKGYRKQLAKYHITGLLGIIVYKQI